MSESILFNGIPEGMDDVVLTEDIFKSAGTVFTGKDLIAHGGTMGEEWRFVSAEFLK